MTPQVILAAVILIASLALNLIKVDFHFGNAISLGSGVDAALPDGGDYKVLGLNHLAEYVRVAFNGLADNSLNAASQAGSPYAGRPLQAAAESLRSAAQAANLVYLCYAVPIAAAILLVQVLRGNKPGPLPFITGILAIVAFAALFLFRSIVIGAYLKAVTSGGGNPNASGLLGQYFALGTGAYVMLLAGLALIGLALGLIRLPR